MSNIDDAFTNLADVLMSAVVDPHKVVEAATEFLNNKGGRLKSPELIDCAAMILSYSLWHQPEAIKRVALNRFFKCFTSIHPEIAAHVVDLTKLQEEKGDRVDPRAGR